MDDMRLTAEVRCRDAPKVKDVRTGRSTTRVNQVLKGDLGPLLIVDQV